mgnify:CR=1 FL=1
MWTYFWCGHTVNSKYLIPYIWFIGSYTVPVELRQHCRTLARRNNCKLIIGTIAQIFGSKLVYVFLVVAVMTLIKLATVNSKPANQTKHDKNLHLANLKHVFVIVQSFLQVSNLKKAFFFRWQCPSSLPARLHYCLLFLVVCYSVSYYFSQASPRKCHSLFLYHPLW